MRCFVGINGAAGRYGASNRDDRSILRSENKRQRPTAALAHDNDNAALAGLMFCKPPINAVGLVIRWPNVAAEICAVHFDLAGNGRAVRFRCKGFADFVSHDECRLVLAIQVAAQLQGAMTFCAVHENRDSEKVVADRKLAAGENGARRDAELVIASLALEQLAGRVVIDGGAFAAGANRLAVSGSPANQLEGLVGFLVRQTGDFR
jgi:hypothetical protein